MTPEPPTASARESLRAGALGWTRVAGLGVALAVSGQFSGWNFGLAAGGWGGLIAAAFATGLFYLGFTQCVAELAAAMPSAGGFETWCNRAFGAVFGCLVGMSVLAALIIAIGVVADFTAAYSTSLLGIAPVWSKLAIFCGVLALQLRGARDAVGVTMVVGGIAIASLLLFCISMAPSASLAGLSPQGGGGWFPRGLSGVFTALPYALWLFLAVEQAALAAEETADPARSIPRALPAAVLTLLVTAVGVLYFAPAGAGIDAIKSADDPLAAALLSPHAFAHGNWLTRAIGAGALIGLLATFFSVVYTASRQLYSLARDRHLPAWLCAINSKQAPHTALLVVVAIGIIASLFPPERAMLLVIFLLTLSYLAVLGAFFRLRESAPQMPRPYRAVGGTPAAAATTAVALLVIGACIAQEPMGMLYSLAACALFAGYFLITQRQAAKNTQVHTP